MAQAILCGAFLRVIYTFLAQKAKPPFFFFGTDDLGRDLFTRIYCGVLRISLTIGLIGVALTFFIGILLGGIAGYYSGWLDVLIQRAIEILMAIPQLPLWMALSAALPPLATAPRLLRGHNYTFSDGLDRFGPRCEGALSVFKGRGFLVAG